MLIVNTRRNISYNNRAFIRHAISITNYRIDPFDRLLFENIESRHDQTITIIAIVITTVMINDTNTDGDLRGFQFWVPRTHL